MGNIKEANIKNQTYYFFNDVINITNFDPNLLKINKKLYENIYIYYIGNIIMKDSDYVKIYNVNPLHSIVDKVDGNFEKKDGNKYLIFDSTDKNKEVMIKYTKLWDGSKNQIEKVNNELGEYGKDFIQF